MDYKISDICNNFKVGKSTVYKKIGFLKQSITNLDCRNNEYFYYTDDNKLFITQKRSRFYYTRFKKR